MAVENSANFENHAFIRHGSATYREDQTVLQDAGRLTDMALYTLMSQDPTTEKWVPMTNIAAVDGTEKPTGILLQTLATADIVAGDVTEVNILTAGHILDREQLVLENSLTLASVIASLNMTIERWLQTVGFQFADTDPISYPIV